MKNSIIIIPNIKLNLTLLNILSKLNICWCGSSDLSDREIRSCRSPLLFVISDNKMKYGELSSYNDNYNELIRRFEVEKENIYYTNKLDDIHKFLKDNNSLKEYGNFIKNIYGLSYIQKMYAPKIKVE